MTQADTHAVQSLVLKILTDAKDLFVTLLDATNMWPLYAAMFTITMVIAIIIVPFFGHPDVGGSSDMVRTSKEPKASSSDSASNRGSKQSYSNYGGNTRD